MTTAKIIIFTTFEVRYSCVRHPTVFTDLTVQALALRLVGTAYRVTEKPTGQQQVSKMTAGVGVNSYQSKR